ncbi:membrane protein insertion efficiency factor [Brachybacterium phenoliresistens]|uniref:Putative membrane protein insertion efficiency factor n=1 Tax=Brachybacterium phenoliresistens TaxID=396014 RepID=Z9JQA1_9MICO|nr:membrane protein insertion efficiency factor YidD [Brachybacterium phenoliresistens]EWS80203.1 membrane protein insertion efficiency factor [Brachybacterium phenoliresistens]
MTAAARPGPLSWILRAPRRLLLLPIRAYQVGISPYTPPACRYYPVCSQYAVDALHVHGAVKGTLLATARIVRCNPISRGGTDPVPAPGMWRNPRR